MSKPHACASWWRNIIQTLVFLLTAASLSVAQTTAQPSQPASTPTPPASTPLPHVRGLDAPTKAELLRGAYGPYRANNDLLFYHLDIRIDPAKKLVSGKNTVRFKMLQDDTRIQLDLAEALNVDKILLDSTPLHY